MFKDNAQCGFRSVCIKDVITNDPNMPHTLPVYATSTFVYENVEKAIRVYEEKESAYIYGRWHNPTVAAVEKKIATLESFGLNQKAEALLFSSGMAAINALLMSLELKKGDAILTQGNLYGTTTDLLNTVFQKNNIAVIYENLKNINKIESLLKNNKNIRLMYIESPANPTCDCYDLKALSALAKQHRVLTCVDNTFATPYLQQPIKFEIDFVIHSATKFLNGHGNALGGVVVGTSARLMKKVWNMRKLLGGNSNAFDAFLLNNGIKTLPIRMDMHCYNALKVATFLSNHPKVLKVNYVGLATHPDHQLAKKQMNGFGGMLSFEMKGGFKAALNMMKKLKFLTLTASLGTADTLIQHPASMTHRKVPQKQRLQYGITDGLIRMSIGLENIEDILNDLEQAM
jgi:methionine-gamma-lyase